ncbi:hypothetical protein ARZXY2_4395 (plasmid) [Arthrobacter sp. ZXY-2]|jgi:hypothetical protein|nr:hypothetical protein ARZXY2_4395 [Arthrobacter sp. ZXY-2]
MLATSSRVEAVVASSFGSTIQVIPQAKDEFTCHSAFWFDTSPNWPVQPMAIHTASNAKPKPPYDSG